MRLLKLFLLLSIGLWADIIPSGIKGEQLTPILDNGWNENNQTLNQIIIDNGQKKLPEILKKLDSPLSLAASMESIPKLLLIRDDYYFIFSYVKYLEYQGEIDQAIKVYTRALKGLSSIKNDCLLSYFYRLAIEKIIVQGTNQMIKTKKVNTKQLTNMKDELLPALLLDRSKLFEVIKKEIEISNIFLMRTVGDIENEQERVAIDAIRKRYIALLKNYYDQCLALKDGEEKEFIETFKKQEKYFFENNAEEITKYNLLTYNSLGRRYLFMWKDGGKNIEEKDALVKKMIKEMNLTIDDLNIEVSAKTLFFISAISPKRFVEMKKDIDEEIVRNKALLKSLER